MSELMILFDDGYEIKENKLSFIQIGAVDL